MIILGISENVHDASACIIKNGRLISAVISERYSKKKKDSNLPPSSISNLLFQSNIKSSEIDLVACALCGHDSEDYEIDFLKNKDSLRTREFLLDGDNDIRRNGYYIPHHICHASSAYYTSNFQESVSLSVDCCEFNLQLGKKLNSLVCYFKDNHLLDYKFPECYSGAMYAKTTEYTGFSPCLERAGTLMGLSAYGKYSKKYEKLIAEEKTISIDGKKWAKGKYPEYEENLKEAMDCAKTVQDIFEDELLEYSNECVNYFNVPHVKNICLSGGSFLNCNANSKIKLKSRYENVHLFPGCGDDGLAIGAALFLAHNVLDMPLQKYQPQDLCYLGMEYPIYKDIDHKYIAQKIAEGKIVGFMNGRSEFGPRALGNRSIFADPRNQHTRDWINQIIKKREWFRPFAPMVLEEKYQEWFDFPSPSPFMLYTAQVKQPEKIPAVTHVDGSSRFQTVNEKSNPDAYKIVKEFEKITGIPILLNTSLNGKGQPILEDEKDALKFFNETEIDMMVVFGKILEK
jgi:carbamoyltransferase